MKQHEYEAALAAMKGSPPRHLPIGGKQPGSIAELNWLARIHGLKVEGETGVVETKPVEAVPEPTAPVEPVPEKEVVTEVVKPVSPLLVIETQSKAAEGTEMESGARPAPTPDPAVTSGGVEIPENLASVKFADLGKLCKALEIEPVPASTAARIAAIEAKRSA